MILLYYMTIINVLAFILYGIDKKRAEKEKYRIPESRLLLVAIIGGAFGAMAGMLIFHHKTRKSRFRKVVPIFLVIYVVLTAFCLYGNYHIVITEYEYSNYSVPDEMDGYTIVQISDLHNQIFGFGEKILLDKIRSCEPDIIVVTGDAVDSTHSFYGITEDFFEGAVKIAPVYYISGNHEKILEKKNKERYDSYIRKIESYGVNFIDDKTVALKDFLLVGVSDSSLGEEIHISADDNPFIVMLAHEPEYLENYDAAGADLVFAGHNHGGQIVIPGKGGLVTADMKFFSELCSGVHVRGNTTMIISRGLGNSILPVRINNYPEIVKVVLRREERKILNLYMPDVVGSTEEGARTKLKDLGFYNVVIEYEKIDGEVPGIVVRQSIPPKTTVSTEFEIIITVSE